MPKVLYVMGKALTGELSCLGTGFFYHRSAYFSSELQIYSSEKCYHFTCVTLLFHGIKVNGYTIRGSHSSV